MICHKNLFGNYLRGVRVAPNKPPSDNQHLSQKFDPKNFKEFQRIAPVTLRLCSCRRRGTACAQGRYTGLLYGMGGQKHQCSATNV